MHGCEYWTKEEARRFILKQLRSNSGRHSRPSETRGLRQEQASRDVEYIHNRQAN